MIHRVHVLARFAVLVIATPLTGQVAGPTGTLFAQPSLPGFQSVADAHPTDLDLDGDDDQIGRASCRERV